MNPLFPTIVSVGDHRLAIYEGVPGDGLPEHVHGQDSVHLTFVCAGRIAVTENGTRTELPVGAMVEFFEGVSHEIEFLEPGTRIVNLPKYVLKGAAP